MTMIAALLVFVLVAPAQKRDVEEKGIRERTFTVSKGGQLEVSVRTGDIRINPWTKNEVHVRAEGIDEEDLDRLRMTQSGNTIRVEFRPRGGWDGWNGSPRFEISIPSEFNVTMKTSGGDLEVTGGVNGRIEGSTSGGDIKLNNVTGTVDVSTSGGDIRVGDISGNAELSTSGGDIEIRKVEGEANVRTSGGDIKVESVGRKLEAKTSGGDIQIGDVGGEANVSTAGGDVRVGKVSGDARLRTAGGNIVLRGASGRVNAGTAGGDIELESISGSIEAKTAGGDIRAELIPTGRGSSELKTAGGNIRLAVPENAKATIEAIIRIEGRWGSRKERYEIRSDFTATTYRKDDEYEEIRATYVLNGGGEKILLETVNSNIEIRKLHR
ncbi:MAG: DUF4097 family beta strand repeat protein [Ignavibacteriales bacterium]|nr:DUF4097 family beta strand repeat protein [Ignavibacteriales bacterium]